jgi:hypothetical protein
VFTHQVSDIQRRAKKGRIAWDTGEKLRRTFLKQWFETQIGETHDLLWIAAVRTWGNPIKA